MKFKFLSLLFLFSILLSCSKETELVESNQANQIFNPTTERPFKLKSHGNFTTVPAVECAPLTQRVLTGTGNATHIGRFDASIIWCTNFADQIYLEGTIIAANGDELYFYSIGFGQGSEGQYGDYIFEGGTGRFVECYGEIRIYTSITNTSETEGTYNNSGEGYLIY